MQPTRWAVWIAGTGTVLAVLPAAVSARLWLLWPLFWALFLVVLWVDTLLAAPIEGVECRLEAPEQIFIGEPAEACCTIRIPGGRKVRFRAALDLSDLLIPVPSVPGACPEGGAEIRFPLVSRRRGTAVLEALWIRYLGPMGLIEKVRRFDLARKISVVPNTNPARQAAIRFSLDRSFRSGLKIERYRGDGTEFDSLRRFERGDEIRSIHWRASAKHRVVFCRQYRAERNHQIILAMDTGYLMSESIGGGIPKIDHAASAALLLSYVGLKSGDRVGLYSFGARPGPFLEPRGGMAHHPRLVREMASLKYSDAETNFTLGLTALSQRLSRRSLVIVLTDFVDTVTAQLMVENLGRLSRKHVVLYVSLRDPDLERMERSLPRDVLSLNRAVVAETFLQERTRVMHRLIGLGAMAMDCTPERVGADMLNRYLEIKRREMI